MESLILRRNLKRLVFFVVFLVLLGVSIAIGYKSYTTTLRSQAIQSELERADRYLEAGDFRKAAESYKRVMELTGKKDPEILKKLARAETGLKNREAVESLLKEVIRLNPSDAEAHFQLALIYYEKRETTKALELAGRAASLKATFIAPRYFLAKQHLLQGDYESAIVRYNEILKINPEIVRTEPGLLKELAFCYEKKGMKEQAIFYYRQALSFSPGDAEIHAALKRLSSEK